MINRRKAVIIGAGFVGASAAYALMLKSIFSEIVLIDANKAKAEGEAMDISHGLPYAHPMDIHAGTYDECADAYVIIVTAGAAQKPGETRLDLIKKNSAIMKSIVGEIKKTTFEGILLIVANPVDVLTHVALKESGYPENRVFGSGTVLDTARFKYELSRHLSVDARNVHGIIIGEHGDSELPVWSITNIAGIPINDFCAIRGHRNHEEGMRKIYESVRDSAYHIIERKGATYYGVATAICRICEVIVKDEHTMLPVSVELHGQYGLEGLCLSIPSIVGQNGVEQVFELTLNYEEKQKLLESGKTLKAIIDTL
ncbi:MAG: L-lactate dehydrogenase [Bacilli bacterium]|nr:L-lactate dehydrogenase [Bacilli bacterium]